MASAGVRVATEIEGKLVGKGCTDAMPSVSSVVMTKPVVLAILSIPSDEAGVWMLGSDVIVTVCACLRRSMNVTSLG